MHSHGIAGAVRSLVPVCLVRPPAQTHAHTTRETARANICYVCMYIAGNLVSHPFCAVAQSGLAGEERWLAHTILG